MIRLIIDKLGSGHADLFLKIDNFPTYSKTGDSYYLLDFLEISEQDLLDNKIPQDQILNYATTALLEYWSSRIGKIENGHDVFLPFDFQDECVGGLLLTQTSQEFKVKIVYSDKIFGYELNKSNFDDVIAERQVAFIYEENAEWLISFEQFRNGLNWSKDELKE
jgi:hypothetical protein